MEIEYNTLPTNMGILFSGVGDLFLIEFKSNSHCFYNIIICDGTRRQKCYQIERKNNHQNKIYRTLSLNIIGAPKLLKVWAPLFNMKAWYSFENFPLEGL